MAAKAMGAEGEMRERLAALAHRRWSGWMRYLFLKGQFDFDGTWTMPKWAVERWWRQMNTEFDNLSDVEKESDFREADKILAVIQEGSDGGKN